MKYLVDFVDSVTEAAVQEWLVANQATIVKDFNSFSKTYHVESAVEPQKTAIVEHIILDGEFSSRLLITNVSQITPSTNQIVNTFDLEDDWWKTACMAEVNFDTTTASYTRRGSKSAVYVFDSGIMSSHPEFVSARIENLYTLDGSFEDTKGHGTALTSVIVGANHGITESLVYNVKIFSSTQVTMLSDLVQALDITLSSILQNPNRLNVVNMSWSIPKDTYVESKINALINAGAVIVAAAGNNGLPIADVTPASMSPRVVTVGSYSKDLVPANFSDYTGPYSVTAAPTNHGALTGWAPGVDIKVAGLDGLTARVSGTSISAAIASACILYNSDYYYYGNEMVFPLSAVYRTFNKKDLLDLSDPKYVNSVNLLVMFVSDLSPAVKYLDAASASITLEIYPNTDVRGMLLYSQFFTTVTVEGALPPGISLSDGWVVGKITDEVLELQKYQLMVYFTFPSGETSSAKLYLNVHPSSESVPTEDKTLNAVLLLGNCTFVETDCVGTCTGTDAGSSCYNCGDKFVPVCICFPSQECP